MMQVDVKQALEMVKRVFPNAAKKWTADEWGVLAEQLRGIDIDVSQAEAVIRHHRTECDGWTPKMKALLDGMRRARAQKFVAKAKPSERPHYLADDRTAEEAMADRKLMAERVRASMADVTDAEWEQMRDFKDRHVRGALRIGRHKWAVTNESDVRQMNVLLAWGAVMRWKHGDGWSGRVWDMREQYAGGTTHEVE